MHNRIQICAKRITVLKLIYIFTDIYIFPYPKSNRNISDIEKTVILTTIKCIKHLNITNKILLHPVLTPDRRIQRTFYWQRLLASITTWISYIGAFSKLPKYKITPTLTHIVQSVWHQHLTFVSLTIYTYLAIFFSATLHFSGTCCQ